MSAATASWHSVNKYYRRISLGPDTDDLNPSKAPRSAHTKESYDGDSQQHDMHPQQLQLLQPSRRSSNASDRLHAASNEPQWPINTGHQLDMSGYVIQSRSFEQARASLTDMQILPYWMDFGSFEMESTEPTDYLAPGTAVSTSQDGTVFPVSPSIRVQAPDQEPRYSSCFLPSSQWPLGQPPRPEDTGLT